MSPFESFGQVDQDALRKAAKSSTSGMVLYLRLSLLAMADANLIGHAEYSPGALAAMLPGPDGCPKASHLSNEIKRARDLGLLGVGSSARCLIAPTWFAKTGGRGGYACRFHGIHAPRKQRRPPPTTSPER